MVYQNNNNRVVPNAVEDRNLKPAATAQNKLITYNPSSFQSKSSIAWKGNAQALASIGQGLMDVDTLWRHQAQENVIKAQWETEQLGGNKKEWAQVSRNINGAAKFNPYNDDAFKGLQAQDIYRATVSEINSTPELEKMNPEKYYQLVTDANKKMITAFKEAGLSPKDYGDSLVQWDSAMKNLEGSYISKHAAYAYKQLTIKQASDLSFQAGVNVYNNTQDRSLALKETIQTKLRELDELGMPADTQFGVVLAGMQGFLAKNADSITGAEFKAAVSDLEFNGQKASEVIPDFDYKVNQLYKEAQKAIYDDKKFSLENHQLDLQIASQDAMKDLYDWTKQNPNAGYPEVLAKTQEIVAKYNLEEQGFHFIKEMANDKQMLMSFSEVKSNPATLQNLGAKAVIGELTGEDINQAVRDGSINWHDALQFSDRINREVKADINAVKSNYKDLHSKLSKNGVYTQSLGARSKELQEITTQADRLITDLNNGKITPEEANNGLQQLERIAIAASQKKQNKASNDSFLLNANYVKSQSAPQYNPKTAEAAFKQLALERGTLGQKVKPVVTSAPNDNRVINGKRAAHKGYDLAATKQTAIHSAPMNGTVIYAGYLKDFGNYAVIKYDNGTYMRVGHLSTTTGHLQGKKIAAGQFIGRAGSTGFSTGTHLHVDFWDKNRQIISAERFQRGIR